jgi:transcription antitermination factor NusG
MPILACEPDLFPSDLLDREPIEGAAPWWVLYTMSRREKQLMRCLHAGSVPFYAPLVRSCKRSPNGRRRVSYVPLFPGYVFLNGDDDRRRTALATNCVSRCIPVANGAQLAQNLRQIHRLIDTGVPISAESRLEAGQRVRVCSGALIGLEGTILKRHGQQRLLVAVEFLQQGASVQIDDDALERID